VSLSTFIGDIADVSRDTITRIEKIGANAVPAIGAAAHSRAD
jgi:hypothetical protein